MDACACMCIFLHVCDAMFLYTTVVWLFGHTLGGGCMPLWAYARRRLFASLGNLQQDFILFLLYTYAEAGRIVNTHSLIKYHFVQQARVDDEVVECILGQVSCLLHTFHEFRTRLVVVQPALL
jgi:hypothetical protein